MARDGHDDVTATAAALALPLPAVVIDGGVVVAANKAALGIGSGSVVGSPLADWFVPEDAESVERAFEPREPHDLVHARLRGTENWVELLADGQPADEHQVVLLRPATDERFVRAALDVVADSTFVLDGAGGGRWRSARLRDRSGVTDEVAARTRAAERIHPEDLPLVFRAFTSATEDRPVNVTARSRGVDDDDRWETIELTIWNRVADDVIGGYLVQVRNLDQGRTLQTALGQAEPDLLSLTDAAPVGIAVTDPAGHIVYRNPAARALLGPELQSFVAREWLELARPEHRAPLADAFSEVLHDGLESTVVAAFDAAGSTPPTWLRLRVTPQRTAGDRTTGVIATIEDVTDQIEARAKLKAAEARMRHLATHDPLTGLPNRTALTEELERAASRHARSAGGLAVLFCDLDGFKPVNDQRGHAGGDRVLVEVAGRLRASIRASDFVARLGGDEFVVVCEGVGTDTGPVEELAGRIHAHVEPPFEHDGGSFSIGVSIGIAMIGPGKVAAADDLLLLADEVMYEAKAAGPRQTRLRWLEPKPT